MRSPLLILKSSAALALHLSLLIGAAPATALDSGIFIRKTEATRPCLDWLPDRLEVRDNSSVISQLQRFFKTKTIRPDQLSIVRIYESGKSEEYLKWMGVDTSRELYKITAQNARTFTIEISHTTSKMIWSSHGVNPSALEDIEKTRQFRCSDSYELPAPAPQAVTDPPALKSPPQIEQVGECLVDMKKTGLSVDDTIPLDNRVGAVPFALVANEIGTDAKVSVTRDGEYCRVNIDARRFAYLAKNVPVISSGWAPVYSERALCSRLEELMRAKLKSNTPTIHLVVHDRKETFVNYYGTNSVMHELLLLQVCEHH